MPQSIDTMQLVHLFLMGMFNTSSRDTRPQVSFITFATVAGVLSPFCGVLQLPPTSLTVAFLVTAPIVTFPRILKHAEQALDGIVC